MKPPNARSYIQFAITFLLVGVLVLALWRIGGGPVAAVADEQAETFAPPLAESVELSSLEVATLGGGCFWCVEAVFERIDGVEAVLSGYAGGEAVRPTYYEVIAGGTGHAEVVQVAFDPQVISYREIVDLFFKAHDPTTLNRQGNDVGPQYRSIVLYHSEEQLRIVEASMAAEQKTLSRPIVTQVQPFTDFYPAEVYHQDYFDKNPNAAYCTFVIRPKLEELDLL
jgi:peptide-methionine (S)-S-oxide reductase